MFHHRQTLMQVTTWILIPCLLENTLAFLVPAALEPPLGSRILCSHLKRKTGAYYGKRSSVCVPPPIQSFQTAEVPLYSLALDASGDLPPDGPSEAVGGGGTATISNEIFNLVKCIVGAGVLSLPAGIASFANAPSAVLPASILIILLGGISGYCFSLIGRVCARTNASSYSDAWEKTIGTTSSFIPAVSCTFKTLTANLAYSMILADTFKTILASVGIHLSRSNTLFGVTGLILLPLCLLQNLSSLAPFSLLGIFGMVYTAIAMIIRYLDRGYAVPSGKFLSGVPMELQPSFGTIGARGVFHPSSFILICTLSTAYMAHFNAAKFYKELKNNTLERYNTVVGTSFGISIALFIAMAATGFLTFGQAASGLILNNYSIKDSLMGLSRIAVAISIVFSYPLVFSGARDGLLDLLSVPAEKRTSTNLNKVTVILLTLLTTLALVVKDLSFVLSFGGATLGNALIYVYPPLMFQRLVRRMGDKASSRLKRESAFSWLIVLLGIGMGLIGSKAALQKLAVT